MKTVNSQVLQLKAKSNYLFIGFKIQDQQGLLDKLGQP
ncbi:hypothetical protein SLEP1_g7134 [Rubroshorea leprosula]|uniref:Uncharacterized protein n=1 Tax=Rubroshorea leprosula TaxID=152421 RepID=A0AAV5I5G4_9ROSI|nr:hypothetical protein SLEP1_g7134 [Rubroshorea leprosula]